MPAQRICGAGDGIHRSPSGGLLPCACPTLDPRRGRAVLRVNRRLYRIAGVLTVDTPKSEAEARTLPLPAAAAHIGRSFPVTADAVERLRAANVVKQVTMGNRAFEAVGLFEALTGFERVLASSDTDSHLSPPTRPVSLLLSCPTICIDAGP